MRIVQSTSCNSGSALDRKIERESEKERGVASERQRKCSPAVIILQFSFWCEILCLFN